MKNKIRQVEIPEKRLAFRRDEESTGSMVFEDNYDGGVLVLDIAGAEELIHHLEWLLNASPPLSHEGRF